MAMKRSVAPAAMLILLALPAVALAEMGQGRSESSAPVAGVPWSKVWNDNPDLNQGEGGWEARVGHWNFLNMGDGRWAGDENNYVDWPAGASEVTLKTYDDRVDALGTVAEIRQEKPDGPTLNQDVVVIAKIKAVRGGGAKFPSNSGVAFGIFCENTLTGEPFYFEPYICGSGVNRIWQTSSGVFYRWQGVPHQTLYLPKFPEFCLIAAEGDVVIYTFNLSKMFQAAREAWYLPLEYPLHKHTRLSDRDPAHWQVKSMNVYPENQYLFPGTNGAPQMVTIDYFALTYVPDHGKKDSSQ